MIILSGSAVDLLLSIKRRAEYVRRFTPRLSGGPTEDSRLLCAVEADIEEWFAEQGMSLYPPDNALPA